MSGSLAGVTALVTGASRGIGHGLAEALAGEGAHVVAVARDRERLNELAEGIAARGGSCATIVCDITDEQAVARMSEQAGDVDVLVNNAGVAWERPFVDLTLSEMRQILDVNVVGTFLVSQAIGRGMIARRSGRIINIGSVDAVVGTPGLVHYCASKGAVVQFTRALAAEWARHGVTVNCLCPGYIETDINAETLSDPDIRERILRRIPLRRFGAVADLTGWILLLASENASYSTGQIIVVDGGESAR